MENNRQNPPAVNRNMKSTLFYRVFSDKVSLLELYNAVNGTQYADPEALRITTLQNVIYMGMKNDVSFLFSHEMSLYEHQSTVNPNMPLRGVFYFSSLYKEYVRDNGLDVYGSSRLQLPAPRYIVFYNGVQPRPEREELRLSDLFYAKTDVEEPALECRAAVLNINLGHNRELMEKCHALWEYAYCVARVRYYWVQKMELREAVDRAIEDCIREGVLTDILARDREEARDMILEEYDAEFHIQCEKALSRREGALTMLFDLVKDGCLTLQEAALRAQLSEEEFTAEMEPERSF